MTIFKEDLKVLERKLNKVIKNTCNITGGTGDASEATLQAILTELQDDAAITETIVKDSGGVVHIRRTEVNQDTGLKTTTYLDPSTNTVTVPTFPLVIDDQVTEDREFFSARLVTDPNDTFIVQSVYNGTTTTYTRLDTGATLTTTDFEPDTKDWETVEVHLVDDVAGDGTGDVIGFTKLYALYEDPNQPMVLLKTVDEKGGIYTVQGVERNPYEIGGNGKTSVNQITIQGTNWSPTEDIAEFSYVAINIQTEDINPSIASSTFTGTNGVTNPIFNGESGGDYTIIGGTEKFDVSNIQVSAGAADIIKIQYTQITA